MVRTTSHHSAFPVWRLKGISGISEGDGAELEGAEGKTEAGKGAQRKYQSYWVRIPWQSHLQPRKGAQQPQSALEEQLRGLEKEQEQKDKTDTGREGVK